MVNLRLLLLVVPLLVLLLCSTTSGELLGEMDTIRLRRLLVLAGDLLRRSTDMDLLLLALNGELNLI